jgi:hypothetical protein
MPNELAFEFDGLNVAVVQLSDHAWIPIVREEAEFVS